MREPSSNGIEIGRLESTLDAAAALGDANPMESSSSSEPKQRTAAVTTMNPDFADLRETGKWGSTISRSEIVGVGLALILVLAGVAGALVAWVDWDRTSSTVPVMGPPSSSLRDTVYHSVAEHNQALRDALEAQAQNGTAAAAWIATQLAAAAAAALDEAAVDWNEATANVYARAAHWLVYADPIPSKVQVDLLPRFVLAVTYFANGGASDEISNENNNSTVWKSRRNWMTDQSQCDWYGIECNGQDQIVQVDLSANGLTGPLHSAWALLEHGRSIMLNGNQLTGTIPGEVFGSLPLLIYLQLQDNLLTGTVPVALKPLGGRLGTWTVGRSVSIQLHTSCSCLTSIRFGLFHLRKRHRYALCARQ
jgi:hypothetical protein